MSEQTGAPQTAARDFPLVITEGNPRFVFKFNDEGVALGGHGLVWRIGDAQRAKAFSDIAAIRLRVMPTPGAPTGQCTLTFMDGQVLNVMSWTAAGFADAARAKIYRDFVGALHGQLSAADRARIAFTSGFPGAGAAWQQTLGTIALVAAALLFVVAPLGVALIAGDLRGYALALGGGIVLYGLYWKVRRGSALNEANTPQHYAPDHVPDALMP